MTTKHVKAVDMDRLPNRAFPPAESPLGVNCVRKAEKPWSVHCQLSEQSIVDKMEAVGTPLKEWDVKHQLWHQNWLQRGLRH